MERPLTPLQQAYLLGRSEQWPLGGVAMHDFREYHGRMPDLNRLKQRLTQLVQHYAALRTSTDVHRMTQQVRDAVALNLDVYDLRSKTATERQRQLAELRQQFAQMCHDPAEPLWRLAVIQLPKQQDEASDAVDALLLTSFDALILDGPGISTIIARLFDNVPLTPVLPNGVSKAIDTAQREADQAWWQPALQKMTTPPALPWKTALKNVKRAHFRSTSLLIPRGQLRKLLRLGSAQGLLRNSTLSALILDTLAWWTQDGEICVGVPVAFPSEDGELKNDASFVAMRYSRHGGELAQRAMAFQDALLSSLDHLAFSGVDIARALSQQSQGNPALPVILTNCLGWETLKPDAPMRYVNGLTTTPQVAIDFRLMLDEDKNLLLRVDYVEQVLGTEQIDAMLMALKRRLDLLCDGETLDCPAESFIDTTHYRLNSPDTVSDRDPWLVQLADNLLFAPSNRPALKWGEESWSYVELGEQVRTLMAALQQRGLKPGNVLAIGLPRTPHHIMLTMACALSGIIWVPIDVNSPPERLRYLLNNCQPDCVVHQGDISCEQGVSVTELFQADRTVLRLPDISTLRARSVSQDASYYLYTSGTTGKPKCVVLNYCATANVLTLTRQRWQVTTDDVFISVTPLHHDMSMFDLFGAFCSAATLVLPAPHQEKDAISWNQLVERHCVTLWCSVPAILEMLLSCKSATSLQTLRLVAQGGDYIKPETVQILWRLKTDIMLFSLGGPTETTIWSIWHAIVPGDKLAVPYGQPLAGNRYFICHSDGTHCPTGVTGRIYTAGINLASGYLQDGELSQQDFVSLITPQGETVRAFRTGDEGYYRPDGNIMFANRINGYVKIRGVRVSLPEVEEVLKAHPAITEVVVVDYPAQDGNETNLGAVYLTCNGAPLLLADMRAHAQTALVCTHIPTRFIHLAALPLSANGKTDRHQIRAQLSAETPIPLLNACAAAPAGTRGTECTRILAVYSQAIGSASRPEWNEETPFILMGLKLSHLRDVVTQLNSDWGSKLTVTALINCKNARQVAALLAS